MSPLAGYMMSRYSTSSFRNDEQIMSLRQSFQQDLGCDPEFFKSVIFEFDNEADVALSWQLTQEEIDSLHDSIERDQNRQKLAALCDWWKAYRGACGRTPNGDVVRLSRGRGPHHPARTAVHYPRVERSEIEDASTPGRSGEGRRPPAPSGPGPMNSAANPGGE
jgi:hypothetical protein